MSKPTQTPNAYSIVTLLAAGETSLAADNTDDHGLFDGPGTPDRGEGASLRAVHASPEALAANSRDKGAAGVGIAALVFKESDESSLPVIETGLPSVPDGARTPAIAAGKLIPIHDADRLRAWIWGEDDSDPGNDGVSLPAENALQTGNWTGSPLSPVNAIAAPALPDGGELQVIATGLLGEPPRDNDGGERPAAVLAGKQALTVLPCGESFDEKGKARLRVVHASQDTPLVDAGPWDGTGSSDPGLAGARDPVTAFQVTTAPGLRVFAVAAGSLFGESAEGFRLLLVDTQEYPRVVAGEVLPD